MVATILFRLRTCSGHDLSWDWIWCEPQVSPLIDSENQAERRKGRKRVQRQSKIELMGKYWLRSQLSTAAQLEIQHRAAVGFGRSQEWCTRHKSGTPESLLLKWLSPHRAGEEPLLSSQPLFWSRGNFKDELRYCSIPYKMKWWVLAFLISWEVENQVETTSAALLPYSKNCQGLQTSPI